MLAAAATTAALPADVPSHALSACEAVWPVCGATVAASTMAS
jgi:hypothetical protein